MNFDSASCPIFIISRDRLTPLSSLVKWLEGSGHQRIIIVDSCSTFPPLLEYYEETPHEVIRLESNVGPRAVWDCELLDHMDHGGAFVLTDSDVVPDDNCPTDAVDHFAELLFKYPDVDKVGFGLRIDDLPSTYRFRDEVILWESQFWSNEVEPGVFRADIDTTFALYRRTSVRDTHRALRTGPPYLARHMGWYSDSQNPSDEELYYRAHAQQGVSNWDLDELPEVLVDAIDRRRAERTNPVDPDVAERGQVDALEALERSLLQERAARRSAEDELEAIRRTRSYRLLEPLRRVRGSTVASSLLGNARSPVEEAHHDGSASTDESAVILESAQESQETLGCSVRSRLVSSAVKRPETHARHQLIAGPPYSIDSALHVSRYTWAIEHLVRPGDTAVDLGCGTGFGVDLLSKKCKHVVGVDLDPEVSRLADQFGLTNAVFFCDDACSTGLEERIGVRDADIVLSMETIEHLEDYFSYIENAIQVMSGDGVFVVGTPNRTVTYERYPERRHMDPSHVQEFTAISLEHTLRSYFDTVDLYLQYVPGFWDKDQVGGSSDSEPESEKLYDLNEISFAKAVDHPALLFEAFALVAVCSVPTR